MRSRSKTVDEYIENLEGERKEAIIKLRTIMKTTFPNLEESMKYGMPTYTLGKEFYAFASQKNYISLYIHEPELLLKYQQEFGRVSTEKSCIRFKKLQDMKFEVIQRMLEEAAAKFD